MFRTQDMHVDTIVQSGDLAVHGIAADTLVTTSNLGAGKVALVNSQNGKTFAGASAANQATALAAAGEFRIVQNVDGKLIFSNIIKVSDLKQNALSHLFTVARDAAAEQVTTVTFTGPSTADGNVTLALRKNDMGSTRRARDEYVYGNRTLVSGTSANNAASALGNQLEANLAEDAEKYATASVSTNVITITGQSQAFDVARFRDYKKARFVVAVRDLPTGLTAAVATTTKASEGRGTAEQVAMDEYIARGFNGEPILDTPPRLRTSQVNMSAFGYSSLMFHWESTSDHMVGAGKHKGSLIIYGETFDDTTDGVSANFATDIVAILTHANTGITYTGDTIVVHA